jgi:folate-binding protein YgfZ
VSIPEEYIAIRERVGIADLSHDGHYLISGEDRTSFLQNLISNDVRLATGNKGIYSTLLTAKGKIIADFYLYSLAESYLLTMKSVVAEKTFEHLMRFRLRSKIDIVHPPWGKILVSGPKARPLLQKLFNGTLPEMEEPSAVVAPMLCVRQPHTGEASYYLYCRKDMQAGIWTELLSLGEQFGVATVGISTLETVRIEAGIPQYGVDLTEEIIPIEAGLEGCAISYTKGCYPGQEVVARIKTYGHVNRHRVGLILNGREAPSGGEKIFFDNVEVGWITAGTFSPFLNKPIATAYLKTSVAIVGANVVVPLAGQPVLATVTNLPFYQSVTA